MEKVSEKMWVMISLEKGEVWRSSLVQGFCDTTAAPAEPERL